MIRTMSQQGPGMVSAEIARNVLVAIAQAMPDGHDVVTGVDIRAGWGGAVHVRVHSRLSPQAGAVLARRVRQSLPAVLPERHTVELLWASAGAAGR
jgi:hypothetical protein